MQVVQAAICPERDYGLDDQLSAVASVTEAYVSNDLQASAYAVRCLEHGHSCHQSCLLLCGACAVHVDERSSSNTDPGCQHRELITPQRWLGCRLWPYMQQPGRADAVLLLPPPPADTSHAAA